MERVKLFSCSFYSFAMQDFKKYISQDSKSFLVIVKPNTSKTKFLGFDEERKALRFAIAAPPENNKANDELLRFLKKELGHCKIILGKTSRKKKITILSKTF